MPPFFIALIYAALSGLFGMLAGYAVERRDYGVAGLWTVTALGLIINGALHMHRVFMGAA